MAQTAEILVVCAFNICRSPATSSSIMQLSNLKTSGLSTFTAGTELGANDFGGSAACSEMVTQLSKKYPGIANHLDLSKHRSVQITEADVERADLILVMERQQRSHVVRLLPSAQRKTFLLTQAARLSNWLLDHTEGELDTTSSVTHALDRMRGITPFVEDVDVDDPHRTGGPSHSAMLKQVEAASHSIAALLRKFYS